MKRILQCLTLALLCGCRSPKYPDKVTPVSNFDLERYLGTWYEIARLDHSFERGMEQVTADYSMREDGGVRVQNRGYLPQKDKWKEAEGKAYFVQESNQGYLKVSFFGPFYGSYVIFELDKENYQYAFVSGPNNSYLWLLSRTPTVSDALLAQFRDQAQSLGFKTEELIYVSQE
ncbi:lipocalin family protein [Kiritimatiellota bacterium B12222]|nr:lipocalin family protein [Kiritimatiellota bacterium B12222]